MPVEEGELFSDSKWTYLRRDSPQKRNQSCLSTLACQGWKSAFFFYWWFRQIKRNLRTMAVMGMSRSGRSNARRNGPKEREDLRRVTWYRLGTV